MESKIIITGGNGFIGSFLGEKLCDSGNKVISLDTSFNPDKKIESFAGNISDSKLLENIIDKGDVVVHLACSSIPAISEANQKKDIEENLLGTINLLEVLREKQVSKLVYLSSGGTVYGNTLKKPVRESDETHPKNSHGALKISIEKYIGVYGHLYGLQSVIIRPGNVYGRTFAANKQFGAVDVFLQKALNSEPISIWGDGSIVRDYIHVSDVVDFIIKAISNNSVSGIFNLGTGKGTSQRELVKIIEKILEKKVKVIYTPKRSFDVKHNVLDISKAEKTGWKPKFSLEDGIRDLYQKISRVTPVKTTPKTYSRE